VFDFLKGGKAQINLTLDRPDLVYYPGETIQARVNVIGEKDLKIQQGRITFLYSEEFQIREHRTETDSHGHRRQTTHSEWKKDERQLNQTVFLPETTIASGANQNFDFAFLIPPDALPSVNGNIVRIKWLIRATLDRKMAGDIEAETEISIPSTAPGGETGEGRYGNSNEPLEVDLQFLLPSKEFVLGETIAGTLLISPQKEIDVDEVRLALVQRENVPQALGNTHTQEQPIKLANQVKLHAGQPLSFPFNVTLPPNGLPSSQSPNSSITWLLVGTLARRLRKDTFVEESVSVYSQRSR
jgi:Arrestin (or S-antigen), N-terminal domain/SpoOM protein